MSVDDGIHTKSNKKLDAVPSKKPETLTNRKPSYANDEVD
jgi:hypothetical protein